MPLECQEGGEWEPSRDGKYRLRSCKLCPAGMQISDAGCTRCTSGDVPKKLNAPGRRDLRNCVPCKKNMLAGMKRDKLGEGMKAMGNGKPKRLVLTNWQSPGDITMLTAAVRDLHRAFPGKYKTDPRTSCRELWEANPNVTTFPEPWIEDEAALARDTKPLAVRNRDDITVIPMTYGIAPDHHFVSDFHRCLGAALGVTIPITDLRGDIHLSADEKAWMSQTAGMGVHDKFWLVNAGGKWDFTAKFVNWKAVQSALHHFMGRMCFVQVGDRGNFQAPLSNAINLVGQTSLRMLIRLIYHCDGIITPLNGIMHFAAAVPLKYPERKNRPCVVLAGGREHMHWEAYPGHRYLSYEGALPCCATGGCDKARCTIVGDRDDKDAEGNRCMNFEEIPAPNPAGFLWDGRPASLPELRAAYIEANKARLDWYKPGVVLPPIDRVRIAKCQRMIHAEDVIRAVESYYEGGIL